MASGSKSLKRKSNGPDSYTDEVWKRTKGTVDKKLERAEPFRIFMSPIESDPDTHIEESTLSFPGVYNILYYISKHNNYRYSIIR